MRRPWGRKTIGLVLGTLVLASALTPLAVQAYERGDFAKDVYGMHQRHFDPDKMAQKLADTFSVNKDEVLNYSQQGVNFRDLFRASFMAKASGQSLKTVLATKTYDNTWKDVAQSLGVTRDKMRSAKQDIDSTKLEKQLNIPKQTSLDLMQQGYRARDIAVATELTKNTDKSINDILAMRKITNTWYDVAQSLGVDENTFGQDMKNLQTAFPHGHGHHGSYRL